MNKKKQIPETPERMNAERTAAAADAEAIMRKYDRESNTRIWEGVPKIVVGIVLAAFSLYCIYVTLFATFLEQIRLSSFLGLVVIMGYLTYPARKGHVKVNYIPWYRPRKRRRRQQHRLQPHPRPGRGSRRLRGYPPPGKHSRATTPSAMSAAPSPSFPWTL